MRFSILFLICFLSTSVMGLSLATPKWELDVFKKLSAMNVHSASLEIKYTLTADCDFILIHASETTHNSVFNAEFFPKFIAKYIGPYKSKEKSFINLSIHGIQK